MIYPRQSLGAFVLTKFIISKQGKYTCLIFENSTKAATIMEIQWVTSDVESKKSLHLVVKLDEAYCLETELTLEESHQSVLAKLFSPLSEPQIQISSNKCILIHQLGNVMS